MNVKSIFTFMQTVDERLYEIAEPQAGYFTTAQAAAVGVSRQVLYYLRGRGNVWRVAHGIQRLARFPASPHEDMVVACLWAGADAVVSHESALVVYGVGESMPTAIHITIPRLFRGRRKGVIVHRGVLADDECTERDGIPLTTVQRAVADVAAVDPTGARRALEDALAAGLIRRSGLAAAAERYEAVAEVFRTAA